MRSLFPVILFLIGSVAECLELYRVDVPYYKRVGESAELQCQFHLGRDRLYAVKWYKDNEEFFRYVPRFNPSIHTHPVPGVHVDVLRSTAEVVVLKSTNVRSSGVFRCEVSAEAPSFASFHGEGRMTVVYLPKEGPQITGNLRDEYEVGDMLDLNCTSSKSFPPARISFYINDMPVSGHTEPPYYHEMDILQLPTGKFTTVHPSSSSHGNTALSSHNHLIRSTTRRLLLHLTPAHFGAKGTAKIRCVARIFPLFWQEGDEKQIDHKGPYKHSPEPHPPYNHVLDQEEKEPSSINHPNKNGRFASLYKGEALIQIRGGTAKIRAAVATSFPIFLHLFLLMH